ncbi:MAG: CHRD domain-containing protein [Chitinophagaceae bacterium]
MKKTATCLFYLFLCFVVNAQAIYLKAVLDGSQQVPANASAATGIAIIKYEPSTKFLELFGDYQGLTTDAVASHIHSPAVAGVNAPVLINLTNTGSTTGTLSGTATLSVSEETDLLAGKMYVNIHNSTNPGGEIRGQLTTTTTGQTEYLTARIQGAQEVPPNAAAATGKARLLLDKTTGMVYLTGSFTGLADAATAAHIHTAAPNVNGPVIIPLTVTAATQGTLHIAAAIAPADQILMSAGNAYVNIHNAIYPGGEIRGQLIAESELVYLKAGLQGSQEVPSNASTAAGTVIVRYNRLLKSLELTGSYQNIAAAISASHIHSAAAPGVNAPVLFTLTNTGGLSGTLTTSVTLNTAQEADLLNGLMYVNVHNASFPGGEIRGQLTTTTAANQTFYFTGKLSGAQENPANGSAATGDATALLDKLSGEVYLTGSFSGLAASASASHIHRGATGSNGPVIVGLSPTLSTAGSITGNSFVSTSFADSMIRGLTYVNVHNASFPGGEIRAQFGNQVLPVKLSYFNGYKQSSNIILLWESSEELNLQQYEIEQQGNESGKWINRAVIAAGNTPGSAKYRFTEAPLLINQGYCIYRLKMIDKDGHFSYSKAIRINFKAGGPTLSIASNPVANGILKYVITGLPENKKAVLSIVDYGGRIVLTKTIATLSANSIQITHLAAGMYQLIIQADNDILHQAFKK